MAILFHNVKTGERRRCETEPMIAAHLNSSDRSPNAHTGQDMGWRLAPATVIELERVMQNPEKLRGIAADFGIPSDNVTESDVLNWLSRQDDRAEAQGETTSEKDFEREYEDDIRKLRDQQDKRDEVIAKEARAKGEKVPERILNKEKKDDPAPETEQTDSDSGNIEQEQSAPVDITQMKRGELNSYAESVGIEKPESFKNAPELIEVIKAKEAEEA